MNPRQAARDLALLQEHAANDFTVLLTYLADKMPEAQSADSFALRDVADCAAWLREVAQEARCVNAGKLA